VHAYIMRAYAKELAHEVVHDARVELHEISRYNKAHKTPWQPIPVLLGAVLPTVFFAVVYYCCSFGLRFYHPEWAVALVLLFLGVCLVAAAQARSKLQRIEPARPALSMALSLWFALAAAVIGGEENFVWHMVSYYDFQDLAAYTNIDPNLDKGQSYMDAGQVYFREFSRVDVEQMVAYRSHRVYCAAPIMVTTVNNQEGEDAVEQKGGFALPESGVVDFWAVGMDCCDQETRTFTCGAVGDARARAGVRLLRHDVRPFYVLAVQEWLARLCPLDDNTVKGNTQAAPLICPQSRHPLFFHWVVDPLLEVDNYWIKGMNTFGLHLSLFAAANLCLVLASLWWLLRLGVR